MKKINQEEYEKIKLLPDYDWNWIAREKTGKILSFTNKPNKTDEVWKDKQTRLWFNYKDSQLFQFIQWEDEEPHNIAELTEEYESEETEVKNKLKQKLIDYKKKQFDRTYGGLENSVELFEAKITEGIVKELCEVIDQLDETEVTLDKAFEKVAESYPMTKEEIWRHLERLEAHGGKVTYEGLDNPEVLSQKWIDENKVARIDNVRKMTTSDVVEVEKLQNVLVPKQEEITHKQVEKYLLDKNIRVIDIDIYEEMQSELEGLKNGSTLSEMETVEITEEQVMEWLGNNDFYDHITAETVLANAVDKGELGYYGTKYAVVEKPVISKFIANWIESYRKKTLAELINDAVYTSDEDSQRFRRWFHEEMGFESNYSEFLSRAWLDGYEVEEEQKYQVIIRYGEYIRLYLFKNNGDVMIGTNDSYIEECPEVTYLTEQEIKDYDEMFWAFAVNIEELEE